MAKGPCVARSRCSSSNAARLRTRIIWVQLQRVLERLNLKLQQQGCSEWEQELPVKTRTAAAQAAAAQYGRTVRATAS